MSVLPEGVTVAGVRVIPAEGDPSTLFYFPVRPAVALDFRGGAEIGWIAPLALLNVTTSIEIDAGVEETIRAAGRLSPAVRLVPAPLSISRVTLLLDAPGAEPRALGPPSASSGVPPFRAAHSVRLDEEAARIVGAAVREGRDLPLRAVYEGTLHLPRTAEVTCSVTGDVTPEVEALAAAGGATSPAARARVEAAIADGRLRKETTVHGAPGAGHRDEVEDQAVAGAAEIVRALAGARAAARPPAAVGAGDQGSSWSHGDRHHGEPAWVLRAEAGNVHARRVTGTVEVPVRCEAPLAARVG